MDNKVDIVHVMMRNSNIKPILVGDGLYRAYCPFCNDDIPTLFISKDKQEYRCFSCQRNGNITNFLMEMYDTDFFGVVKMMTGKDIDSTKARKELAKFYEMNVDAAEYYHKKLFSSEGKRGLDYWKIKRGLNDETITKFGLGYASPSGLCSHLKQKYSVNDIVDNGLARKKEKNYYDFFYNRVMIPIVDINKNVIGFGGRVLDDSLPKYINTSGTDIFDKRLNLYALNLAQYSNREGLILCEGYLDVISMHQNGIDNAVASLGTALTEEQVYLISRFTNTVTIAYDSDEAGIKATNDAKELLKKQGIRVKRLNLLKAKDPDEFIKSYGIETLNNQINNSDDI